MTTLVKVGIAAAVVAAAVITIPALKGPYNRFKNTANEKLNDEFVVDNYKAEYVNLHEKKIEIKKNIEDMVKKIYDTKEISIDFIFNS